MQSIEDLLRSILRLPDELGIRFAFPSQALYIEEFPEKKSLIPTYDQKRVELEGIVERVLTDFKKDIELAKRV